MTLRTALVWVALAAALLLGAACDDEIPPGGTPTADPNATPTPAPTEAAGADGFEAFLVRLNGRVGQRDVDFFEARLKTVPVVCTEADVPGGPGEPRCEFAGQTFDGVPVGNWRSEGGIVPDETVLMQLEEIFEGAIPSGADDFGNGGPAIYAYDVTGNRHTAIMTAIVPRPADQPGDGPLRIAVGMDWVFENREWRLAQLLYAYVLAEELLTPDAPDSIYPNWQRFELPAW